MESFNNLGESVPVPAADAESDVDAASVPSDVLSSDDSTSSSGRNAWVLQGV